MEVAVKTDIGEQLGEINRLVESLKEVDVRINALKFVGIDEFCLVSGWSKKTVQDLYNKPDFPSTDYGKEKKAEIHAIIQYFSVPRRKKK